MFFVLSFLSALKERRKSVHKNPKGVSNFQLREKNGGQTFDRFRSLQELMDRRHWHIYELCVLHGQGIEESLSSNLSVGSFQNLEDKNG